MSKRQDKAAINQAEQKDFLRGKKRKAIEDRWEKAQLQAATMQSVLGYMVEQYKEHLDELSEEIITQTEEQIALRRSEIENYLMSEQSICLQLIEEYSKED
jgi:hypothetical protein